MRFRFYCDVPPGFRVETDSLTAYTFLPGKKEPGIVRVQFDVTIPDKIIAMVDEEGTVEDEAQEWTPGEGTDS